MIRRPRARALIAFVFSLSSGTVASAAAARDVPRQEPARKATGCESMGEGFVKLEGTDTCVRVGGSVRSEFSTRSGGASFYPPSGSDR